MNSFFSGTDVADEVAGRYFAVLGKIDSELPELALKVAFNKEFRYCKYEEVFDDKVLQLHSDSNYEINYEDVKNLALEAKGRRCFTKRKSQSSYSSEE